MILPQFNPPPAGPGAVYQPGLEDVFARHADLIRVIEIEPQTRWIKPCRPGSRPVGSAHEIARFAAMPQIKLLHGVGYPLGGRWCDHHEHVPEMRHWAEAFGCSWSSEHMSILDIECDGAPVSCGFLMPPCQSDDSVALAVRNIAARRVSLGHEIAFETGVNYFPPAQGELADGDFWSAIAEGAGCGIVLDLHNLLCNERNGRASIDDVLRALPLDRVWELHLAGGEDVNGYWLDAHCGGIEPDLAARAIELAGSLPHLAAVTFELGASHVARFGEAAFMAQIETVNRIWDARLCASAQRSLPKTATTRSNISTREWEEMLRTNIVTPRRPATGEASPAISLYRMLITSFRRGALADMVGNSMQLMYLAIGMDELEALIDDYAAATPAQLYPSNEAIQFCDWVERCCPDVPGLTDCLRFERALLMAATSAETVTVELECDIDHLLNTLGEGRPECLAGSHSLAINREGVAEVVVY